VFLGAFCAGVALLVLVSRRPETAPKPVDGISDDPRISAIFARSCQDCHSDRTRWPWYGHIPPASWMLNRDVKEARTHMDLLLWNRYSLDDKRQILTELGAAVRNNEMPPGRYLWMHPDAKLSADDTARLYVWARSERHKLRARETGGNDDSR